MCEHQFAVWNKKDNFYLTLPCGKWTCPICGKKNRLDLSERLKQSEANDWNIKTHITLTVEGAHQSANIDEAFNDLITYLRRGGTYTFVTHSGHQKTVTLPARPHLRYLKVKEIQPGRYASTGEAILHIHMIVNQYLTKYDIIPIWNLVLKNTFNYVEDTHPHNFNAGKYLLPYLTKEEHQELFERGERRYGCSRGVIPAKPVNIPSGDWEFMSIRKARLVLSWFNEHDPHIKNKIAYDIGFDSRYDSPFGVIHDIAYGVV